MRRFLEISVAALLLGMPLLTHAAPPPVARTGMVPRSDYITLAAGTGRLLTLDGPATNVFVADPKVVEVRPASATTLFAFGVGVGQTTVVALNAAGQPLAQYQVVVQPSSFGATQAEAAITRMVPGSHVRVQVEPTGLLLSGWVNEPAAAERAVAIAGDYVSGKQTVQNQIAIRASTQVTLQVRIVQMARTISDDLGINWASLGTVGSIGKLPALNFDLNNLVGASLAPVCAAGSPFSVDCQGLGLAGTLKALASDGLVRILAEPNLTVITGQPASFLVGGQFPVPVPGQNGQVTIEYKNFGVSLKFRPTVFSDGQIDIHVAPEVSQLSNQNAATIPAGGSTIVVPSLVVSKAETTVQLGSGQSFAIGGLLQDTINDNGSGIPNVDNIPILGALFHHDSFTRGQTELVIIVTPYISRPVDNPARLQMPDENYTPPNDLERLLFMRQVGAEGHRPSAPVRLPGNTGFMVE